MEIMRYWVDIGIGQQQTAIKPGCEVGGVMKWKR